MRDIPNQNAGSSFSVGIAIKCRFSQERIIAADAYSRKRISIQTKTLLSRVLIEAPDDKKATTRIEIANGRIVNVPREAIVSARALHHPQSAISVRHGTQGRLGTPQHSSEGCMSIDCQVPFEYMNVKHFWKLRHPKVGAAEGSEEWNSSG